MPTKDKFTCHILLASLVLLAGCSSNSLHYDIACRSNPEISRTTDRTFAFKDLETTDRDPLIQKQLESQLTTGLQQQGWLPVSTENAHVLFSIDYRMDSNIVADTKGSGVNTYYDSSGKQHVSGGGTSTQIYTTNRRWIGVGSFDLRGEPLWSADAYSTGTTPDVLFVGQYVLDDVANLYGETGNWSGSDAPKHDGKKTFWAVWGACMISIFAVAAAGG